MTILPDEDLPFDTSMLDRLAEVSIRVGLNLQPEQDLIISAPVEALPLVRRLAAEAYRKGAGVVTTFLPMTNWLWLDSRTQRMRV